MELKVITYEESRLEFFRQKRDIEQKYYDSFIKSQRFNELPHSEQELALSEIGERISYWNDIVKMLEDKANENHTMRND